MDALRSVVTLTTALYLLVDAGDGVMARSAVDVDGFGALCVSAVTLGTVLYIAYELVAEWLIHPGATAGKGLSAAV